MLSDCNRISVNIAMQCKIQMFILVIFAETGSLVRKLLSDVMTSVPTLFLSGYLKTAIKGFILVQ